MTRFALISLAAVRLSACGTRGTTDTLYIAGNAVTSMFTNSQFGTLSTTSPYTVTVRAQLTGAPELTGTGDARLGRRIVGAGVSTCAPIMLQ